MQHDAFRERLQGVAPSLSKPTSDTQTYEDEASESLGGVVSPPRTDKLHVLLPASNPEVNLCKTLMSASILGYPTPTLIAWNETFDTSMPSLRLSVYSIIADLIRRLLAGGW